MKLAASIVFLSALCTLACSAQQFKDAMGSVDKQKKMVGAKNLCDDGRADACYDAGKAHEEQQRLATAKDYYQRGCRLGHGASCQSGADIESRCANAPADSEQPCYRQ